MFDEGASRKSESTGFLDAPIFIFIAIIILSPIYPLKRLPTSKQLPRAILCLDENFILT